MSVFTLISSSLGFIALLYAIVMIAERRYIKQEG